MGLAIEDLNCTTLRGAKKPLVVRPQASKTEEGTISTMRVGDRIPGIVKTWQAPLGLGSVKCNGFGQEIVIARNALTDTHNLVPGATVIFTLAQDVGVKKQGVQPKLRAVKCMADENSVRETLAAAGGM